jgi:hypothetical protein
MSAGRPPSGPNLVEGMEGDPGAKERLRTILEVNAGRLSVDAACERLKVSAARFHVLREEAFAAALEALSPGAPGRPRKEVPPEAARIADLERELRELKIDLRAAETRTEIALTMPHLLHRPEEKEEKKRRKRLGF